MYVSLLLYYDTGFDIIRNADISVNAINVNLHGQYGYKGHNIINLPQDITTFATSLPRRPSDLDILLVRREG